MLYFDCSFAALHGLHASRYALASPYSCYTPGLTPPSLPTHPTSLPAAAAPPAAHFELKLPSLVTTSSSNHGQSVEASAQVLYCHIATMLLIFFISGTSLSRVVTYFW